MLLNGMNYFMFKFIKFPIIYITFYLRLGFINGEYTFINIDIYAQMHQEDRLLRPWKLISSSSSSSSSSSVASVAGTSKISRTSGVVSPSYTDPSDVMGYQGLMTVTLKIDDYNGRYHDFQKRLMNFSSVFKNETEVRSVLSIDS